MAEAEREVHFTQYHHAKSAAQYAIKKQAYNGKSLLLNTSGFGD